MEDILDTFLVEVGTPDDENKHGWRRLKRLQKSIADLFKKSKARHTIAGAIEDMKKRLQEVADRRDRFSVPVALPAPQTKPDPRLADMHKEVEQLIGIDKAKAELMAMLLPTPHGHGDSDASGSSSSGKMQIVSVVGVGGLGKTTLARAVYDDLIPRYDCGAFVSVGRNPDLLQVFTNIIFQLDRMEYAAIREVRSLQLLAGGLRKILQKKRYFIVIDDVWDTTTWKIIKSALDLNSSGSRVITTTRNREAASIEEVYELCPLSHDNSEKLFYTRLFGVKGECPANHPDQASKKLLNKCGGVPLAIITMSSLLVGKSREDWFDVCNSPGFYRGKGNQQVADTEWILSLSYYNLPSHLRTCLLYLSVYPEDYVIHKKPLIWKWIAEGFVENKAGSSLFQCGEEYFNQLINRSMIQVVVESRWQDVYGCRVHDMVLDLIRGLSDDENFVTISNDAAGMSSSRNKVRRLAHHNRMMKQTQQYDHVGMAQVRSLVACRCDVDNWVLHPRFKLLRVLHLEGCRLSQEGWQGLKHLGNLLQLRYLGLLCTPGIHKLPEEIGKLKFLQILDLRGSLIEVLPFGICQLTQLVCLYGGFTSVPNGLFLTKLTSLEHLYIRIDILDEESQRQFVKDLGSLSEARVVDITCSCKGMVQSDLVQSLGNLHKLQHLYVRNLIGLSNTPTPASTFVWDTVVLSQHLRRLDLDGILFSRLPSCISPAQLPSLNHLWLCVDYMDEASLQALGGLPELQILALRMLGPSVSCTATVANITAVNAFFQKLRCCKLYGWMVQMVVNEDSTTASFSIWNDKGANSLLLVRKSEGEPSRSGAPLPMMQNLKELTFSVPVMALYKDGKGGSDNLGLECLPSLREVIVYVECEGASSDDVGKAEADLRNTTQLHPNRPMIYIYRINEDKMMGQSTDQVDEELDQQEGDVSSAGDKVAVAESRGNIPTTPSC